MQQPAYGGYGAAAGYAQPYGAPAGAAAYPGYGAPAAYPGYGAPAADPYAQVSLAVDYLHAGLSPAKWQTLSDFIPTISAMACQFSETQKIP